MKKRKGLILFLACFALFASLYVPVMADAEFKTIFFIEDGKLEPFYTSANTVEDFFSEREIQKEYRDTLNMDFMDELEPGVRIELYRAFNVDVAVDGVLVDFRIPKDTTAGEFKELFEEANEELYYLGSSLDQVLTPGDIVYVETLREETIIEESEIPFEIQREETVELLIGTENTVQEGQHGKLVTTYYVLFLRNEEYSRELVSEEIEREPQTEIIKVGTAQPTPTPVPAAPASASPNAGVSSGFSLGARVASVSNLNYSRMISMSSTAYTAGPCCTGKRPGDPGYGVTASGMRVQPGVVAVDPRVIPLGTRLYVDGYGFAVAADTGGAIKGNKIDVYMEGLPAARQWGRRQVNVYVLD